MRALLLRTVVVWVAGLSAACGQATFGGFDPPNGGPHSLILARGVTEPLASVVWDAGQPDERVIPTSLIGPRFSVPRDAEPGPHPVALQFLYTRTKPINFTVDLDPLRLDHPRIDHLMPLFLEFEPGTGRADFAVYVQGANFEVGSIVKINGTEVPTIAHKGIRNELYGVPPDVLGYPIHHYVSLIAIPGPRAPGDHLSIVVHNPDPGNSPSAAVDFVVPASSVGLDSDGDALDDEWEKSGHDTDGDGVSDVDPLRRDILIELDVMDGVTNPPVLTTAAQPGTLDVVRAMFAAAPFLNPLTANGIHVTFSVGSVCAVGRVFFDAGQPASTAEPACDTETAKFSELKHKYFDHKADGDRYHYVIWAHQQQIANTGNSDMPPSFPAEPGDDAIVAIGGHATYRSERSRAEVLAHELGHNLAQRHGGATDESLTPNYWSVMSNTWMFRKDRDSLTRMHYATCLPFYYATAHQGEPGHNPPASVTMVLGYSAGMARRVTENNMSLKETVGVCNEELDWDEDGVPNDIQKANAYPMNADANEDGDIVDTMDDFANWPALRFDGPKLNGTLDHP